MVGLLKLYRPCLRERPKIAIHLQRRQPANMEVQHVLNGANIRALDTLFDQPAHRKSPLCQYGSSHCTIFLTSHVLEVVERLCDRLAIINRGRILVEGTLNELRAQAAESSSSLEEIFVRVVGARVSEMPCSSSAYCSKDCIRRI